MVHQMHKTPLKTAQPSKLFILQVKIINNSFCGRQYGVTHATHLSDLYRKLPDTLHSLDEHQAGTRRECRATSGMSLMSA